MKREAFNFYRSYYDVMLMITDKNEQLKYILALLDKQFNGVEPNLTGQAQFAYISQKHSIDKQIKGWEDKTGFILTPPVGPYQHPTEGSSEGPYLPPTEGPTEGTSGDSVMTTEGSSEGPSEGPYLQEQGQEKEKVKEKVKEKEKIKETKQQIMNSILKELNLETQYERA